MNRTLKSILAFGLLSAFAQSAFAWPEVPTLQDPVTVEVEGTLEQRMVEPSLRVAHRLQATSSDMVTGSLSGSAVSHVYSRQFVDYGTERSVVSTRVIFTNDGQLWLSETGEKSGVTVRVFSTVSGGTGIFRGATGHLVMEGVATQDVAVRYTYRGSITFVQ